MNRVDAGIYRLDAPELAPLLLGKLLCRGFEDGSVTRLRITETEAYYTEADTACHAHRGRTPRTEMLYSAGGVAYVYLCYGIHSLLNVVCGERDVPQAVLIRALEGVTGPGRLTKRLGINREFNGEELTTSERLWLEEDGSSPSYITAPRVGIDYASAKDIERPWRFIAK